MNLLNFVSEYPNEESCKRKWKEIGNKHGVVYQRCGTESHCYKQRYTRLRLRKLSYSG
jgi:hypothetical protein